jgi:hypothetical protein
MPTINTSITTTWTQIAAATDADLLATWNANVAIDIASTASNNAPTVQGHRLTKDDQITRSVMGPGYIWAKVCPGSVPATVVMVVSK